MKKPLLLIAAALVCAPLAASAKDLDFSKFTCKEFLELDKNEMAMVLFWVDGYMSAANEATVMTDKWIEKLGTHLGKYCAENPKKTIMDAEEAAPSE